MGEPEDHPNFSMDDDADASTRRVLYPVVGKESEFVLHLAASITDAIDGLLLVGHVDVHPDRFSVNVSRDTALTRLTALLDPMLDLELESRSLPGDSPLDAIEATVDKDIFDLVILEHGLARDLEPALSKRIDCDTVVVNEGQSGDPVRTVLAPVAGGPHADVALHVAGAIAEANDAAVTVLHVLGEDPSDDASEAAWDLLEASERQLPAGVDVASELVEAADPTDRIIAESADFDVTVIGAPTRSRLQRLVFESDAETIVENAGNTVLMARRN